ncbi:hypothetical protein M406DRAFT_93844 [Cryphonectria parasitica EP155]|uniref:Fe2OG dioxygenase domain-containing protein n=1 Tax=Cryphonectria parasitica (strain ATCC 38755 / EP155) TaxID=660469 RepID=A0A9P5CKH8_CRYP1|nr:uncharacterized protein M406DRAFT_93844 [Cryphonectria parasitica EP155]KAF3760986.1 hypothetical protein M406DRAFT_93844 [Cryphonectria parasitica EP155]
MSLLPIDPADFPDVPTRKALLAIDFQNDFLSEDGALPVKQPEGMVDRVIDLAEAIRDSGYGEVIWVRSQFEANRSAGDQQIMVADTPQLPMRPGAAAARIRKSPSAASPVENDPEAFLSVVGGQAGKTKPQCVRKGTRGAELLPPIAAAKGPGDYAMTKSYYSAFQSGQLLDLLRRKFATELYICGSMSNVSVYATALAASSHGFSITIVEDCCGYRSEMRHMNTARKLMEQTGCEFTTAADVRSTLLPGAPSSSREPRERSPPHLLSSLDKLKLSSESPEPAKISQPVNDTPAVEVITLEPEDDSSQPKDEPPLQPVVTAQDAKAGGADAQEQKRADHDLGREFVVPEQTKEPTKAGEAPERLGDKKSGGTTAREVAAQGNRSHVSSTGTNETASTEHEADNARPHAPPKMEILISETLLMMPTPDDVLEEARVHRSKTDFPSASSLINTKLATQQVGSSADKIALCEGDTTLTLDFLPPCLIEGLFERLCYEVHFKKMLHQGGEVPRFVAVQGQVDEDGTEPVYRHPSDESPPLAPFTPAVEQIRLHVARTLGHPINHVLIQCYRNGNDYISEHSDKTLDIVRGSYIANVSLGAERIMIFRQKRGERKDPTPPYSQRQTIRCPMPHNSLIKMGLMTNEKWLHGIRADKRPQTEKSQSELAWNGIRISLTFRFIGTFLTRLSPGGAALKEPLIWGQGATSKVPETARPVVNGQTPQAIPMLKAFGKENHSPSFDWEANYGRGYDVLHMKSAPRYFGCGDTIVDGRVRIMLAECGVKYARGDIGFDTKQKTGSHSGLPLVRGAEAGELVPVKFLVDDADRTPAVGDAAILLYLDMKHPRKRRSDGEIADIYSRFYAALALEQRWKQLWHAEKCSEKAQLREAIASLVKAELSSFNRWATPLAGSPGRDAFVGIAGGAEPSIADYALWPVLHDMAIAWSVDLGFQVTPGRSVFGHLKWTALENYYVDFAARKSVMQVFGEKVIPTPEHRDNGPPTQEDGATDAEKKTQALSYT